MNTQDKIELPSSDEAAAHMLPSDLKKFEFGEHVAEAFSIAVGNPKETSQPLFTLNQVRAAIEADRKRIATALESRFIVADSKANVSHPDYQYFVGAADAYDIAEQIVKGELDE